MKLTLTLLTAAACVAMPLSHINQQVNFPAPAISVQTGLSIVRLQAEFPQGDIYYAGGIVGYFGAVWESPIWTTPYDWYADREDQPETVAIDPVPVPYCQSHPNDEECNGTSGGDQVPEPGTWLLMGAGLVAVGWRWRK